MPIAGQKHDKISLPGELCGNRINSADLDLSSEAVLDHLSRLLGSAAGLARAAEPGDRYQRRRDVLNPADHRDVVGQVREDSAIQSHGHAMQAAQAAAASWASVSPADRAGAPRQRGRYHADSHGNVARPDHPRSGKSVQNAIAEVREAIDFLRYYAEQARRTLGPSHTAGTRGLHQPLELLAIFSGQGSAALVPELNPVLAEATEETPLIAAEAVRILHGAGVPHDVVRLVPAEGQRRCGACRSAGNGGQSCLPARPKLPTDSGRTFQAALGR